MSDPAWLVSKTLKAQGGCSKGVNVGSGKTWLQAVLKSTWFIWKWVGSPGRALGADATHQVGSLSLESLSWPCGFGGRKAKVEALPTGQLKSAN